LIADNEPHIKQIRGIGLMIGVELDFPGKQIIQDMLQKGVLGNVTAEKTIRFIPPLTISEKDLLKAIDIFYECFTQNKPS
jgi:acetylornithine/succinyldiaminopimelate/putrescine aminotransferase